MKENKHISASGSLLVATSKSSRLAAMGNKTMKSITPQSSAKKDQQQWVHGLKPALKSALQQADKLIVEKVDFIVNGYPTGKKNTFFKLKHGMKLEQIKDMPRKDVFRLLNLETAKIKQFQMIENLDCNGRIVE